MHVSNESAGLCGEVVDNILRKDVLNADVLHDLHELLSESISWTCLMIQLWSNRLPSPKKKKATPDVIYSYTLQM